ncbi:MAG: class I SAM-dependent methyltransferase [Alicyclobacillaceae bacterium]|nr:class I SAM-dependent methyltransferase [Alicyclobacillaceae bacterium]
MADHYFSESPASASEPRRVSVSVRGVTVDVWTDSGVFAKRGLDYGTKVLLEHVQLADAGTAVDLGCGHGVVAAVLGVVYPASRWVLLDINERAVALAKRNTAHLGSRAQVLVSDGFSAVPALTAADVVLNPPIRAGKAVVYRLFEESRQHMDLGGRLWVVIQKKQGAPSAKEKLATLFRSVDTVARDAGYHVFRCTV